MKGASHLKAEVLQVTPQVAQDWLKEKAANRSISHRRILHYTRHMRAGEWRIAQPILIDEHGVVFDGQHRLRAVIDFGKPVDFLVVKGYPCKDTFGVVDDTRARSLRDWLQLRRIENASELASLLRLVWNDENGQAPANNVGIPGFSPQHGLELLDLYPELHDCVKAPGVHSNGLLPRALSAFLFWKFWHVDKALAKTFFVDLIMAGDENLSDMDPILQLHSILRRSKEQKSHLGSRYKAAITVKAWNAVRVGKKSAKLKMMDGEAFPVII